MLHRLKTFLKGPAEWGSKLVIIMRRPVAWGAVILSYVGVITAVSFTATTSINLASERERDSLRERDAIVMSGQAAVRNSCEFDNQRARELRVGLRLFLEDHHQLHAQVNQLRQRDGLPSTPLHRTNIHAIEQGIKDISLRDCDRAASVITSDPKHARHDK